VVSRPTGELTAPGRHDLGHWRLPALLAGIVLVCLATLALAAPLPPTTSSTHPARHGLTSLPTSLAPTASASIGASERTFWPVHHGASLLTKGGGIHGTFTASGAALRVTKGTLGLSLTGLGRGLRLNPVAAVAPIAAANELLYRHGSISEFYRNGPYGLEQGFSVGHRPTAGEGSLVLALSVAGSLFPRRMGSQVLFRTHAGATVLRYGQLSALDAAGRRLPAHMQLRNGTLQLRIDDSNARYPLRIDPFIQQGEKLTGSGENQEGIFGWRVALSGDGNTALIGGNLGNAWVFTRAESTWTQQAHLVAGGLRGYFQTNVALSRDGNTALIGGYSFESRSGAAWVFARAESTWTQQGSRLSPSDESGDSNFGSSVALSGDGNTALIGGPNDNWITVQNCGCIDGVLVGAAWVFTRSGSTWTQQGSKLTGSDEIGQGSFGASVALSGDGNTALVGGPGDHSNLAVGAAWVFTRSESGNWTQQGSKVTPSDQSPSGYSIAPYRFGASVALSGDGNTALIGDVNDNFDLGAAWVFTRSDSSWTQQGEKLTGSDESPPGVQGYFGESVALSGNGNTALVGGPGDNNAIGAAWVFTRSDSTWIQQGSKLTGSGQIGGQNGGGRFGSSVAMSGDGNTSLIGGREDNNSVGAAWVFVTSPAVVTEPASSVTQTSASLNATVNPNGQTVSDCHFEYGTTEAYGPSVPCSSLPASGESPVEVSASLGSLSANTAYHFRIVATNPGGTSYGSDQTFTTLPAVVTKADENFGAGGGTASTANASGTSSEDPLASSVTTPVAGEVTINEAATTATSTTYTLLGQQVTISAPQASVAQPLTLAFDLDPSLLSAAGADPATVTVFRDGTPIADCTGASGTATPDPCVTSRMTLGNGALRLTVLSSHASSWTFGVRKPYVFRGFLTPIKNAPAVNTAKAGSSLPVKFSLGGFQGTLIYAEGSPTLRQVPTSGSTGCTANFADRSGTPLPPTLTTWDRTSGTYLLAIKSAKPWAGTCRQLNMRLADGTWHQALFRFS
jgi:hypothetical protein